MNFSGWFDKLEQNKGVKGLTFADAISTWVQKVTMKSILQVPTKCGTFLTLFYC